LALLDRRLRDYKLACRIKRVKRAFARCDDFGNSQL